MCRSLVEVDKWSESEEVTGQVDKQEAQRLGKVGWWLEGFGGGRWSTGGLEEMCRSLGGVGK